MTTARGWILQYLQNEQRSELDAAILVARLIGPDVDVSRIEARLSELALRLSEVGRAWLSGDASPWLSKTSSDAVSVVDGDAAHLDAQALTRFIADVGFVGATGAYYALDNSRIDRVISTGTGIPITLAVVYIEVGRRAGLATHGVGFPGHFLVDVGGALVDPFSHTVLSDAEFAELMERQFGAVRTQEVGVRNPKDMGVQILEVRQRATPDAIALRMINNVKGILLAARGEAGVPDLLELIDCQLLLGGEPATLHVERSELWGRLRSVEGVRAALEDARRACSDPGLAREIERRLGTLPAPPSAQGH